MVIIVIALFAGMQLTVLSIYCVIVLRSRLPHCKCTLRGKKSSRSQPFQDPIDGIKSHNKEGGRVSYSSIVPCTAVVRVEACKINYIHNVWYFYSLHKMSCNFQLRGTRVA